MAIGNNEFKASLGRFASGVTVVTLIDGAGKLHGLTVSAFCSVSLDPPLILVCIEKEAGSFHGFAETGFFVVNILKESQREVSDRFAEASNDKFTGLDFALNQHGVPVLGGCLVNLDCRLEHSYGGGDHAIFVGEVESTTIADGQPLVYFEGNYRTLND